MQTHYNPEAPYEAAAKREELYLGIELKALKDVWEEFQDELEVEKAIYEYDPQILAEIIKAVALQEAGKQSPEKAYERISHIVNDFIENVAQSRAMRIYDRR